MIYFEQWRIQEFCSGLGGGGSANSVEESEKGSSGGSCNLVQEISFHTIKFY